jgi:hypothetical protein
MRLHVTLREGFDEDTIQRIVSVGNLENVDLGRARRFGIVSGDGGTGAISRLKALSEVLAVEADGVKRALHS